MKFVPLNSVLVEIEKLKGKVSDSSSYCNGWQHALRMLELSFDTLEVKEVDLDYIKKELDELIRFNKPDGNFGWGTLYNVATHFFELGVNTSNPLTWKDMKLIWNITDEMDNMPEEEFYKEVLKRFKAQKGEQLWKLYYLDLLSYGSYFI